MNIHYDVYWLWYGGHTQVRLSGLQELGREEVGSKLITHRRDIKESVGSRQLERWRWDTLVLPTLSQFYLIVYPNICPSVRPSAASIMTGYL